MAERRSAVVAWAAGISVVAATLAGIAASRGTPLLRSAWFIAWLAVALIAFVLLLVAGVPDLADWLRERKSRPQALPVVSDAAGENAERPQLPISTSDHHRADVHAAETEHATMPDSSSSKPSQSGALQARELEELERLVVARYQTPAAIERLLSNSGIDPQMLDLSGPSLVVAHRGLALANAQEKLRDVVNAMQRDYPEDAKLKKLGSR
jgi:Effector-associated domain 1